MRYNCWATRAANDQAAPTLALDMSSVRLFANCRPTALTTKKRAEHDYSLYLQRIYSEISPSGCSRLVAIGQLDNR